MQTALDEQTGPTYNGTPVVGELAFFVPGKPQTAGSKSAYVNRHTGRAVVTESGDKEVKERKRAWRSDLRDAAERAAEAQPGRWPADDPEPGAGIEAMFVFVVKRPSTHLRTGRAAGVVKDWAIRLRPTTRPDALKLGRAAEDALTGILWRDDSTITDERLTKAFGDQVGLGVKAEGLLVVVRRAGSYSGPAVNVTLAV